MKRLYKSLFIALIVLFTTAFQVNATTSPSFPSCLNPQGTLTVQYLSGVHGVPGDYKTYNGIDNVYQLTSDSVTQCLCAEDGKGIQTNWWKIGNLTQNEIDTYKNNGWTYIPNGSAWGLNDSPYLAKNISYSCVGGAGGVKNTLGDILGLASTGNIASLFMYAGIGITLISAGYFMRSLYKRSLDG